MQAEKEVLVNGKL